MPGVRSLWLAALIPAALAASSAASAQTTGWILWEKYHTVKGDTGSTTWEPQDGFETVADCRTSAKQLLQFALAYMKDSGGKLLGPVQLDGRMATFTVPEAGGQRTLDVRYLCFPAPFDPRSRP